ncbi:MAG: serine/threonine-protein kinase [Acidobacteriota bacterium]
MSHDAWSRAWEIFEQAVGRPAGEIEAFLDKACAGDPGLRRTVEELIAADREEGAFIDQSLGLSVGVDGLTERLGSQPLRRSLEKGSRVGPYRILRRVGEGGMSIAYLAVRADDTFERRVVLKLLRPGMDSQSIQQRLRTERQILASLEHPYIARLYDGGTTEDGLPYFVLEFVEGVPLDDYCDQSRLSVDERLVLFRKVCSAVHYAHQNLVVHRDLKPSNILVTADGEPRLLDFGIAKLLNPELQSGAVEATATWHQALTPNYASPEQVRGKLITTASDVYSLGVLLYKLLTGHLPHQLAGLTAAEIEQVLDQEEPLPPSVAVTRRTLSSGPAGDDGTDEGAVDQDPRRQRQRLRRSRQLGGDLDAIVLKALRSTPHRRYGSVEQMATDIERFQDGRPVLARAGSWRYRLGKFVRRHRRAVTAAAAAALVLVSFAVALALQSARVTRERDQVQRERDKKAQVLALILEVFEYSNPFKVPGSDLTVRQALERSLPRLDEGLREEAEARAELLHTTGSILGVLGHHDVARAQLEEAYEIRRQRHGEDHPESAASLAALAAANKELGDFDLAEEQARKAVDISRRLQAEGHPASAAGALVESLNHLVSVLCFRNEFEAADEPAREALQLARALPGGSLQELAALEHLARIRSAEGSYREAIQLNRAALERRRRRDGEDHPGQIPTLNNLGLSLRRLDDLEEAERAYQRALDLTIENFGRENLNPYVLNNLASVRLLRGEFEGAEELFRQARQVILDIDSQHWMVFHFEVRIAMALIPQGQAVTAELRLRSLLERWRPRLGDHWRFAEGRGVLGESLSVQGKCTAAEAILVDSFDSLLAVAKERTRQDALSRLRGHFGRCGDVAAITPFEARLRENS